MIERFRFDVCKFYVSKLVSSSRPFFALSRSGCTLSFRKKPLNFR